MQKIRASQTSPGTYGEFSISSESSLRSHIFFATFITILFFAFRQTWLSMEHQWSVSSAHGHGYLIAPIALWLSYRKRNQLLTLPVRASLSGLVALLLAATMWLIGEITSINLVAYTGLVAMIPSLFLLFYGPKIFKALIFPFAFLFFMVPAGDFLIPLLMKGTTEATVWALGQTGLPVYKEGNHLSLPTGRWSVIETCAGLNYVIAAGVLGTLYAHLTYTRRYKQIIFLCSIMFVSLIANWIRAYLTIMAGHLTNMKWGPGREHVTFGWIIFGFIIGLLFWVGSRWADTANSANTNEPLSPRGNPFTVNSAIDRSQEKFFFSRSAIAPVGAVCALLIIAAMKLASTGVLLSEPDIDEAKKSKISIELLPTNVLNFKPEFSGWRSKIEGQIKEGVQLFIGYYAHQADGFELASSENRLIEESGEWIIISNSIYTTHIAESQNLKVREAIVQRGNSQFLVWYWYTTSRGETTNLLKTKLDTLQTTLMGRGDRAALSSISTEIADGDVANARKKLNEVVNQSRQATGKLMQP